MRHNIWANFRIDPSTAHDIDVICRILDINRSVYMRRALRQKIRRDRARLERAHSLGITAKLAATMRNELANMKKEEDANSIAA